MSDLAADRLRWRDETLEQYIPKAQVLADSLQAFLDDSAWFAALTDRTVRGTIRPPHAEHNARFAAMDAERSNIISAERALRTIAKEAGERINRKERRDEREDAFTAALIEELAFGWTDLSIKKALPSSREFAFYVEKAVDTLCDCPLPEMAGPYLAWVALLRWRRRKGLQKREEAREEWIEREKEKAKLAGRDLEEVVYPEHLAAQPWTLAQCTKALLEMEGRAWWDRLDRPVQDIWPPGTELFGPLEEFPRSQQRTEAEPVDETIRSAVHAMGQGGPEAVTAAYLLTLRFAPASEPVRARYIKLGFSPEAAMAILLRALGAEFCASL
jgi:hypothetical protein